MATTVSVNYSKNLGGGVYRLVGRVNGEKRAVTVRFEDEPSMAAVERALIKGVSIEPEETQGTTPEPLREPKSNETKGDGSTGSGSASDDGKGDGDDTGQQQPPSAEVEVQAKALLDQTIDEIRDALPNIEDVVLLQAALALEESGDGPRGTRSGATEVIEARLKERLTAEAGG